MEKDTSTLSRPKYLEFADEIREKVRRGDLKPGDRLPSLSEARARRGLGRSTLERAHALLEKDGLIVREHGRGTFITQPARATTGCIGFLRHQTAQHALRYPYWSHLIEGMQTAASRAGCEVLLLGGHTDEVRWEKVDAVISSDLRPWRNSIPALLPCVSVINRTAGLPSVVADEYSGVQAAVHHLLALGHQRIGYLMLTSSIEAPLRLTAYRTALCETGIEPLPQWIRELTGGDADASRSFVELGRSSMRGWLSAGFGDLGCTALLMQNDETAIGAIEVLRDAGFRVPEDISVVGFDGTEVAEYCSPPLTTVVMPLHQIGERAVELALKLLEQTAQQDVESAASTVTLPTRLRVRETTTLRI